MKSIQSVNELKRLAYQQAFLTLAKRAKEPLPFVGDWSDGMDLIEWLEACLDQPDIGPGFQADVVRAVAHAAISALAFWEYVRTRKEERDRPSNADVPSFGDGFAELTARDIANEFQEEFDLLTLQAGRPADLIGFGWTKEGNDWKVFQSWSERYEAYEEWRKESAIRAKEERAKASKAAMAASIAAKRARLARERGEGFQGEGFQP